MKAFENRIRSLERKISIEKENLEQAKKCMKRIIEDNRDYEIAQWMPSYQKSFMDSYTKIKTYEDMIDMIEDMMSEEEE